MLRAACPGIVASAQIAENFRSKPTIEGQLARRQYLDMTVASIGNVSNETHVQAAGMATRQELEKARQKGATGIICCRFVDANGAQLAMAPDDRLIAATLDDLRRPAKKLLVVCRLYGGNAGF